MSEHGHGAGEHEHHEVADALRGGVDEGTGAPGDATTEQLMAQAVGGWRGMLDSSLPSALFLVVYVVDGQQLAPAVWTAVAAGVVIAVLRLARRQSVQQVLSGFVGLAFCAWLASRTGRAEDFYLPGLITNLAYGLVLAISCVVGHPLLGYAVGAATGDLTGWRSVPEQRRAYALATWFFVGVFTVRLLVQVPLYLAGAVAALGTAKLILGWPLFALAAYLAFRVITRARREAPVPERVETEEQQP
ncbi:MAG: DUF3159 domain-containing protein [Candidatus Nanopelagicales bacterium]